MFDTWLFYIMANTIALLLFTPFVEKDLLTLTRHHRMAIFHRIFSSRNKLFQFLHLGSIKMDADSKALDELISLYRPHLDLNDDLTNNDIEQFRYHSKQILTALFPARSSSCLVQHHTFQYNTNQINMYSIQHEQINDWKCSNQSLILYFHGGGFVFGDIDTYSGFECHLSKSLNMLILHVDFRLIPEHSLKETIEDVINVYQVLLDADPNINQRLIGMGDSSGGMLWIYLLQWIISNNKPVPQGVVLHSPWPNLNYFDSNLRFSTDNYLSLKLAYNLRQLVIGKDIYWFEMTDEELSKINPKDNSFEEFPPVYITAGTNEISIETIRDMTEKMRLSGVKVILDEGEGLMHTYALFHLWSPQGKCVQEKIHQWIQEQLLIGKQAKSNINGFTTNKGRL
ncbi:unnamed protein product [Rotaria sp. Silwood2]|nr:unnamed protein product [Rotaria sp. Silwood2]CAF3346374.1 unnamed protein product [Rotaria sp. Silwood2]CAF4452941.1 unnamed protein product [Rotaria sp. Silwood2]CAF4465500.1 unnamed protein product [Rotaria sp. Silwood2]